MISKKVGTFSLHYYGVNKFVDLGLFKIFQQTNEPDLVSIKNFVLHSKFMYEVCALTEQLCRILKGISISAPCWMIASEL